MSHSKITLADVKDSAPGFGADHFQARFARDELGASTIGLATFSLEPNRRLGFGHSHAADEEIYVVTRGSGRIKIDDDIVEAATGDAVFCPTGTTREWEAGPDGLEYLAFGAHTEGDGELHQGWWTD